MKGDSGRFGCGPGRFTLGKLFPGILEIGTADDVGFNKLQISYGNTVYHFVFRS